VGVVRWSVACVVACVACVACKTANPAFCPATGCAVGIDAENSIDGSAAATDAGQTCFGRSGFSYCVASARPSPPMAPRAC
jgi:hypothetical protein